jgi:hypothetical protein
LGFPVRYTRVSPCAHRPYGCVTRAPVSSSHRIGRFAPTRISWQAERLTNEPARRCVCVQSDRRPGCVIPQCELQSLFSFLLSITPSSHQTSSHRYHSNSQSAPRYHTPHAPASPTSYSRSPTSPRWASSSARSP